MLEAKAVQFFCSHANRTLMPTFKSTLLLIITHLTTLNLSHATIKHSTVQHNYACHCWAAFQFYSATQTTTTASAKGIQKAQSRASSPLGCVYPYIFE